MNRPPHDETFRRIFAHHRDLWDQVGRIGQLLRERTASIDEVSDLLAQLGDRLIKHFMGEESDGYFDDMLLDAPRLVGRANDLLAQHPRLSTRVKDLVGIEPAGITPTWWDETERRFDEFVKELLAHERGEDRLLQEAYTHDIEACD
jgi:hypothetical protein